MVKRLTKRELDSLLDVSVGKPTCIDSKDAAAGRGRDGFTHVELRANLTAAQSELLGKSRLSKTAYLPAGKRRYEAELKALVEEFERETAEKIRRAAAAQGLVPGSDGTQRFAERMLCFLEAKGDVGESQSDSTKTMLRYSSPLHEMALEDIAVEDVEACVIAARDSPRRGRWAASGDLDGTPKDAVAYNLLCFIRNVLGDAVDKGVIEENVADSKALRKAFPRPDTSRRIDPFLPEEQARLRRAICEMPHTWHRVSLLILLTCGLRPSELFGLQHQDLDLFDENPALHVRRAVDRKTGGIKGTKTESGCRTVPLCPLTARVLREWEAERRALASKSGIRFSRRWFVCSPHVDRCASPNSLNRVWARLIAGMAGEVPYKNKYQCRHSYAVTMIRAKVDLLTVSRLLGHADPLVTIRRYLRWMPDAGREAAERFEEVLDGYDDMSAYLADRDRVGED